MTEEQEKELRRLERYIQAHGLVSVMNNTKWEELRLAVLKMKFQPEYRLLCLRDPDITNEDDWECHHVPPYKWIEWVDIDPIHSERRGALLPEVKTDMTEEIIAALRAHSIPFEHVDGRIRVYGYRRPGNE